MAAAEGVPRQRSTAAQGRADLCRRQRSTKAKGWADNDQRRHKHSPVPRPTFSLPPESSSKTFWAPVHGSTATKSRGYTGTASASALASTWRFFCYTRCCFDEYSF
ncbi:hypothetical protein CUMW_198540 [Citrus unshiu]|nr:hypothetical protein CUMW_198540 [Citrus unshiu]